MDCCSNAFESLTTTSDCRATLCLPKGYLKALRSELDHGKTGNQTKVADVQSCDSIAKMHRCGANQQVFKGDAYAAACLLALNSPSELSDLQCYWMDHDVPGQFLSKGASVLTVAIALGPIDAVSQLYDGHY